MISQISIIVLANFIFLFSFWRRLKDDYVANQIFTTAFFILFGLTSGISIALRFMADWWFWYSILGLFIGLLIGTYKFRMRITEIIEAATISLLPGLFLTYSMDYWIFSEHSSLILASIVIILILLFFFFDRRYKRFSWYKSGRVGFSGFTILGLLFLMRALLAINFPDMLSSSGGYEVYLSGVGAFLSFLAVFHLAQKVK